MSEIRHQIRRGAYADSIVLMQVQSSLAALDGVEDAGVVMATRANQDLLAANGLLPEENLDLAADDLLLVVRAESAAAAEGALAEVDRLMERRAPSGEDEEFRPRSLRGALRLMPEAGWVLVSVPGRWAARVAREALEADRHVFLYSDNVAVEQEVELKRLAGRRRRLVMGPDCGTAAIAGTGLGFANRVRSGPVGLVAAAGTGLQTVASRVHELGSGVSHAIGTGGRDLTGPVGGMTTGEGLGILATDDATRVIVVVSKPPAPQVAARVLRRALGVGKPVVICFLGLAMPIGRVANLRFARSLDEAAELAVKAAGGEADQPAVELTGGGGFLRGLFSGGTLALEVLQGLAPFLDPLYSNLTLAGVEPLADSTASRDHTILDLGEDEFTVGRLHPMIDPDLRLRRLRQETADPATGLILLDVVLGEGSHPDPAGALAPAVREAARREGLEVLALVVGTGEDPQDLDAQVTILEEAGARVVRTVREAIVHAATTLTGVASPTAEPISLEAFEAPLAAVNIGLETFHQSLVAQGGRSVQVDWRPPARGNKELLAILDKMKDGKT